MSLHHQDASPHFQFKQSPHKQRVCTGDPPHITAGHKAVTGVAWWPGFLPMTIDGSTVNPSASKFQSFNIAGGLPYYASKYRTYRYSAVVDNNYTLPGSVFECHREVEIIFTFDEYYGDLASASFYQRTLATYDDYPEENIDETIDLSWNRADDGVFRDSDIFAIITPDGVYWPNSDLTITNAATPVTGGPDGGVGYHEGLDVFTLTFPVLNGTSMSVTQSGTYTHDESLGTQDGTYTATVEIELTAEQTHELRASAAKELAESFPLNTSDKTLDLVNSSASNGAISLTVTQWRTLPTTSGVFTFKEYANTLVGAGTAASATNAITRCYNRYEGGPINIHGGVRQIEQAVVAYGHLVTGSSAGLGVIRFSSLTGIVDWWDEPQMWLGIWSSRGLVNLTDHSISGADPGLFCGNTVTAVSPITGFLETYYYDFETLLVVRESGGSIVYSPLLAGVNNTYEIIRAFTITELQGQLSVAGYAFGSGWIAEVPSGSRPSCPSP